MKKLLILVLTFFATTSLVFGASNLWEYHKEQGLKLPSFEERKDFYESKIGEPYIGTIEQNNKYLNYLENPIKLGGGASVWFPTQNYLKPVSNSWGLQVPGLATSTNGCLSVNASGWISASGSGCSALSGGSANLLTYWTSATEVGATSSPTVGYITATSTATSTFAGSLAITETNATSTFAGGLDLSDGCFAIDGTCLSSSAGTVTSVAMTVPTGLTISGSPITTSGTLALTYTAGYAGVLTASTTNWNGFYDTPSTRITDGTGLTWSSNTLNCDTASGSVQGCLASADWTTFNNKQAGDATLTALAGLTISAGSLVTGTGADAFSVLSAGTNGYVLAMSDSVPSWTATTSIPVAGDVTGTLSATVVGNDSHDHTSTTISGIDISADTNLAVTAPVTLTGDTLSLGNVTMYPAFVYATSSAWTGTTTIPLAPAYVAETWNGVKCFTDAGTLNVVFSDGTNLMNLLNASTTVGTFTLSTNNTFTASEKRYVDIGTPASSPTKISCTVSKSLSIN